MSREPSPNRYLVRFNGDDAPVAGWSSNQAKRLFEAGLAAEADGTWSNHAVAGNVSVAYSPVDGACSSYGTHPDAAISIAKSEIARLRAKADKMEKTLAAYGGDPFIERPQPISPGSYPFRMEEFLLSILRSKWTDIFVNGRHFVRDPSRAAIEKPKDA